ncbi:MAG: hypothetical protein IJ899_03680 [Blautia sp.]|nr:hypothetical protein [Blautia sp.]
MYDVSPAWSEYYRELEPERRAMILERLLSEEPDDGSNRFRKRLFEQRYLEGDGQKPSVDRYLWQCVNFVQLYDASRFFKKGSRKEVMSFLKESGYNEAMEGGPEGEKALYWEIRNASKRYFKTCSGSDYRRALFGLISPGEAERKNQMCLDTWKMSIGIGQRLDIAKSLSLWKMAVLDEYEQTDLSAVDRMQKLISERG